MASLYKTAATVCLFALCGLHLAAAGTKKYKFTAEEVTEDAYLAANLARNGKLPVHITEVEKDDGLVTSLKGKVDGKPAGTDGTCETLIESDLKETFHHIFEYETVAKTTPNYRELLQDALDAGITLFDEEYFNGLIERTSLLKDMTADDLKNSVGDGAAAAAVPTILIAGFVAILTALSA
ncbi:uncharacterized protein EMH_0099120 [Eimeria mitis]|uniref:SAG family member n=1 Tax=Eimeria mitis TaxID=44415 RepID=U6JTP1_9EIME|nr:uncharacterized protein EMH_0099120 [Eimeria mitis]CDJ28151.1 hypothetical protein EMH_0099120 [Eimeria mitis]